MAQTLGIYEDTNDTVSSLREKYAPKTLQKQELGNSISPKVEQYYRDQYDYFRSTGELPAYKSNQEIEAMQQPVQKETTALGRGFSNLMDYAGFNITEDPEYIKNIAETNKTKPFAQQMFEQRLGKKFTNIADAYGKDDFSGIAQNVIDVAGEIGSNPGKVLSFMGEQAANQLPAIGGRLAGLATGAAIGSTFGPVGTIIGGLVGGFAGGAAGGYGTDYIAEKAAGVLEKVKDPNNIEEIKKVIADSDVMDDVRKAAGLHATEVSLTDAAVGLLTAGLVRSRLGTGFKTTTGLGLETFGEGYGEYRGQTAQVEAGLREGIDPADIGLEALGGMATSAATVAMELPFGPATQAKDPALAEAKRIADLRLRIDPGKTPEVDYTKVVNPITKDKIEDVDIAKSAYKIAKYNKLAVGTQGKRVADDNIVQLINNYILVDNPDVNKQRHAEDVVMSAGYGPTLERMQEEYNNAIKANAKKKENKKSTKEIKQEIVNKNLERNKKINELRAIVNDQGQPENVAGDALIELNKLEKEVEAEQAKKPTQKVKLEGKTTTIVTDPARYKTIKGLDRAEKNLNKWIDLRRKSNQPVPQWATDAVEKYRVQRALLQPATPDTPQETNLRNIQEAVKKVQGETGTEVAGQQVPTNVKPVVDWRAEVAKQDETDNDVVVEKILTDAGISPAAIKRRQQTEVITSADLTEQEMQQLDTFYAGGPEAQARLEALTGVKTTEQATQEGKKTTAKLTRSWVAKPNGQAYTSISGAKNSLKTVNKDLDPKKYEVREIEKGSKKYALFPIDSEAGVKIVKQKGGRPGVKSRIQTNVPFTPLTGAGDPVFRLTGSHVVNGETTPYQTTGRVQHDGEKFVLELEDGTWIDPKEINVKVTYNKVEKAAPKVDEGGVVIQDKSQAEQAKIEEQQARQISEEEKAAKKAEKEAKTREKVLQSIQSKYEQLVAKKPELGQMTDEQLQDFAQEAENISEIRKPDLRAKIARKVSERFSAMLGIPVSVQDIATVVEAYDENLITPTQQQTTTQETQVEENPIQEIQAPAKEDAPTKEAKKEAVVETALTGVHKVRNEIAVSDKRFVANLPEQISYTDEDGETEFVDTVLQEDGVTSIFMPTVDDYVPLDQISVADRVAYLETYSEVGRDYAAAAKTTIDAIDGVPEAEDVLEQTTLDEVNADQALGVTEIVDPEAEPIPQAVWHAGPNNWEAEPGYPHGRPRLDKVGTGEGGQLFGWGWYSAENAAVSGPDSSYAKAFTKTDTYLVFNEKKYPPLWDLNKKTTPQQIAINSFWNSWPNKDLKTNEQAIKILTRDLNQAVNILDSNQDTAQGRSYWQLRADLLPKAIKLIESGQISSEKINLITEKQVAVYHLNIPDEAIPYMLQWDRPLRYQTLEVQNALKNATGILGNRIKNLATSSTVTGEGLYNGIMYELPRKRGEHPKKQVSEYLRSLGIVGNKYLDAGSRNLGEGTYNYVIWDQEVLNDVAHLNPETGDRLLAENKNQPKLDRSIQPIKKAQANYIRKKLYPMVSKLIANVTDLDVIFVESAEDLANYPNLKAQNFNADGTRNSTANGWFVEMIHPDTVDKNLVLIMLDNKSNVEDVKRVLFHEVVGHYGMRKVLGDQNDGKWTKFLRKTVVTNRKAADAAFALKDRWAKHYLSKDANGKYTLVKDTDKPFVIGVKQQGYIPVTDRHGNTMYAHAETMTKYMDEYIAEEAKKFVDGKPSSKSTLAFIKRIIAYIRHSLRSFLGGELASKVTDNDIASLLETSYIRLFEDPNYLSSVDKAARETIESKGKGPKATKYLTGLVQKGEAGWIPSYDATEQPGYSGIAASEGYNSTNIQEIIDATLTKESQIGFIRDWRDAVTKFQTWITQLPIIQKLSTNRGASKEFALNSLMRLARGRIYKAEMAVRPLFKWMTKLDKPQLNAIMEAWLNGDAFTGMPGLTREQQRQLLYARNTLEDAQLTLNGIVLGRTENPETGEEEVRKILPDKWLDNSQGKYIHTIFFNTLHEYSGSGKAPSNFNYLKKKIANPVARAVLGEIKNPGMSIPYTVSLLARDAYLARLMQDIVENAKEHNTHWVLDSRKTYSVNLPSGKRRMSLNSMRGRMDTITADLNREDTLMTSQEQIEGLQRELQILGDKYNEVKDEQLEQVKQAMIAEGGRYGNVSPTGKLISVKQQPTDEEAQEYLDKNYVWVTKSRNPGLIPFHNKYVHKAVFDEFGSDTPMFDYETGGSSVTAKLFKDMTRRGGMMEQGTMMWKLSKTGLNIPTYWIRNLVGNWFLLDTASSTPTALLAKKLSSEILDSISGTGRKYGAMNIREWASEFGVYSTTYGASELYFLKDKYADWVKQDEAKEKGNVFAMLGYGVKSSYIKFAEAVSEKHGVMEGIFKQTAMRDYIDRWEKQNGNFNRLSPEEQRAVMAGAAEFAEESIFDYQKVPEWVRRLRRTPLGTPFLTFNYKMASQLPRAMLKHPWKLGKYYAAPALAAHMLMGDMDEDDWDKMKKDLPWHMKGKSSVFVMPTKDANGKYEYWDMTYQYPSAFWIDMILKVGNPQYDETWYGNLGNAVTSDMGFLGGPVPQIVAALLTNKDPFTQREIVPEGASEAEKLQASMEWLYALWMPPSITNTGVLGRSLNNAGIDLPLVSTGEQLTKYGSDKETMWQTIWRAGGFGYGGWSPEESRLANYKRFQYQLSQLRKRNATIMKDRNMDVPTKQKKIAETHARIKDLYKHYAGE